MQNKFRKYNKSLLVNLFMNNDCKHIWDRWAVPNYYDINTRSGNLYTPLIWTCHTNSTNINIIRLLLSHPNIDINIKAYIGKSALICACYFDEMKIVKLLLSHPKIDIMVKDDNEMTVLDYAKKNNNKKLIKLLRYRMFIHQINNLFQRR